MHKEVRKGVTIKSYWIFDCGHTYHISPPFPQKSYHLLGFIDQNYRFGEDCMTHHRIKIFPKLFFMELTEKSMYVFGLPLGTQIGLEHVKKNLRTMTTN